MLPSHEQNFMLGCLKFALYLRISLLLSILVHEWSHLVAAVLLRKDFSCLYLKNILANIDPSQWISLLNPFSPMPVTLTPHVEIGQTSNTRGEDDLKISEVTRERKIIEFGGWIGSCIVSIASLVLVLMNRGTEKTFFVAIFLGSLCALVGATATDILGLASIMGTPDSYFCGNFGLILSRGATTARRNLLDKMGVLESMAAISTQRGGQSGGLVTLIESKNGGRKGVRVRVCPSKRQSLPSLLRARFTWVCYLVSMWEWILSYFWIPASKKLSKSKNEELVEIFLGHTRFATSSIPSTTESHPHQWSPEKYFSFWRFNSSSHQFEAESKRVGIYITHNGDFEFWNLFGRDRTHGEIGQWLGVVLGKLPPATCDSIMIAGLLELLRTKGLWLQSFCLAFQQVVVMAYEEVVSPDSVRVIGAPSAKSLETLSQVAGSVLGRILSTHNSKIKGSSLHDCADLRIVLSSLGLLQALEEAIVEKLKGLTRCDELALILEDMNEATLRKFVAQAVANFLDNDMYFAVKKFLAHAKGSFGMVASCTLDTETVVIAALNQPLSLGVSPSHHAVLYSSEAQALKVPLLSNKKHTGGEQHSSHVRYRLDLNEDDGEIVEIQVLPESKVTTVQSAALDIEAGGPLHGSQFVLDKFPFLRLRIHNRRRDAPVIAEELTSSGRLIDLESNPYVSLMPPKSDRDLVRSDIKDIPRVLHRIRSDWETEGSLNRQTAEAMFEMIKQKALSRKDQASEECNNRREIDLLVVGVENSLWVGEQFAADFQNLFPQLRVVPISANKVIGVMGNARGAISVAGFSFCRISQLLTADSLVLCISQSGQTFPSLHATRILNKHCPGRVFVCVGMLDSKMSLAVNQRVAKDADWSKRVFHTHAEWREAEPATVTAISCHATLTEIIIFMAAKVRAIPGLGAHPLGLRLSQNDISDLQRIRNTSVEENSVLLTGTTIEGSPKHSEVNSTLKKQGFMWALHVLETPIAWFLSALYIVVTVVLGIPLFKDIHNWAALSSDYSLYIAHLFDGVLYCFLPLMFALILRLLTGRQLLARIGMRTIVIADVPYVHQLLEIYVSKLFSLSYWLASVEVHGSNPIDHFVHRFTHRVKRGVLLAVGRPDGRICSQTKCESWVLMAVMQARSIISLKTGAEVVTVGHNPHTAPIIHNHITIPSSRPKFLCEKLLGVDEFEPMKRLASRKHVVQSANGVQAFSELDRHVVGGHLWMDDTLRRARKQGLLMFAHGRHEIEEEEMDDPHSRDVVLAAMDGNVQKILDSQAALEEITENRFLSLERLVAFHVMFHTMAATVSKLWPLQFDIWRSQSCLRIATTAAPVSAADLEREWMDSMDDRERDVTVHRRSSHGSRASSVRNFSELFVGGSLRKGGLSASPGSSLHQNSTRGGVLGFLTGRNFSTDSLKGDGSTHHRRKVGAYGDITPGGSLRGDKSCRGGMDGTSGLQDRASIGNLVGLERDVDRRPTEDQFGLRAPEGFGEDDSDSGHDEDCVKGGKGMLQFLGSG